MFKGTLIVLGLLYSGSTLAETEDCWGGDFCTVGDPIGPQLPPGFFLGPIGTGLGPIGGPAGPGPGSGTPPKDDSEKKKCELEVDNLVRTCQNTYVTYTSAAGAFCAFATFRVFSKGEGYCATAAGAAIASASNWCSSQGQAKKIRDC